MIPQCRPSSGFTLEQIREELAPDFPAVAVPGISLEVMEAVVGFDLSLLAEGYTLDGILETLAVDVAGLVEEKLEEVLPDAYTFCDTRTNREDECDAGLRENLSDPDEETLDDALEWTRDGFIYMDADLRNKLNIDDQETLDRVLRWTREGFTYTDADLRENLGTDGQERLDDFLRWTRGGFTQADLRDLVTDGGKDAQEVARQARLGCGRLGDCSRRHLRVSRPDLRQYAP